MSIYICIHIVLESTVLPLRNLIGLFRVPTRDQLQILISTLRRTEGSERADDSFTSYSLNTPSTFEGATTQSTLS